MPAPWASLARRSAVAFGPSADPGSVTSDPGWEFNRQPRPTLSPAPEHKLGPRQRRASGPEASVKAAGAGEGEEEEEGIEEEEKADVLEPEKWPLPREVGPFFPLLTGGENI